MFRRNYNLISLLKAILKGNAKYHLRKHWFRKPEPVGGIKVMYQHCALLRELGYSASLLKFGKYDGNYFNYNVPILDARAPGFKIKKTDVVVCPEIAPYLALSFDCKRIMFAQNWVNIYTNFRSEDREKSYINLGYDAVFTCSNFLKDKLFREDVRDLKVISNFIDASRFVPNEDLRVADTVLALPRKNKHDLERIIKLMSGSCLNFTAVDRVPEHEIIRQYQSADIFLATGYPEGFGLPPLEAMACGAVVTGFTGGGADEFMIHNETALVAGDGDVDQAAENLKRLSNSPELKARLRKNGMIMAGNYTKNKTLAQLEEAYRTL